MKMLKLLLVWFTLNVSTADVLRLNESEYERMPRLFHLDDYTSCIEKDYLFCNVDMKILPDANNDIYKLIKEYSSYTSRHFDHTQLHYSICVNETCKHTLQEDLGQTLEACLNEPLTKNYSLKAKVYEIDCVNEKENRKIDNLDRFVALFFILWLLLNLFGTFRPAGLDSIIGKTGCEFLKCFSLRDNWRRLKEPAREPAPGAIHTNHLNGYKGINSLMVILAHSYITNGNNIDNTRDLELIYDNWFFQHNFQGSWTVQTYFIISGFLLVLTTCWDQKPVSWKTAAWNVIQRYIRVMMPFAILMAYVMTWNRFLGTGPLWQMAVVREAKACRQDWWAHMFLYNNYLTNTECFFQSWYISADMQLYILGLVIITLSPRRRNLVLGSLLLISVLAPMYHTYRNDFDAKFIVSPEVIKTFFVFSPMFNIIYKNTHTNMSGFVWGIWLGYLVIHTHKSGYRIHKSFRYVFWACFPALLELSWALRWVYTEAERPSLLIRTLHAGFIKTAGGFGVAVMIFGSIFHVENVYQSVLNMRMWTYVTRISYMMFIVHTIWIRMYIGTRTELIHISILNMVALYIVVTVLSLLTAVPLWLMVEAPINQLINFMNRSLSSSVSKKKRQ